MDKHLKIGSLCWRRSGESAYPVQVIGLLCAGVVPESHPQRMERGAWLVRISAWLERLVCKARGPVIQWGVAVPGTGDLPPLHRSCVGYLAVHHSAQIGRRALG